MPNEIKDWREIITDHQNGIYLEKNVSIPIPGSEFPIRCNVYRSIAAKHSDLQQPVIMTYGPYGKDISYEKFHPESFAELNPHQKSPYSAWETPNPVYWCHQGYVIVRCDERGFGQSPGFLDSMSADTAEAFCQAIEWAADQPWSTGKVGLLGVSYYAGTQWRAAARAPRGLTCIIPWEGMSDYYRDRCRHGGILSDRFIAFWWQRQVITNQYGRPGRAAAQRGDDTIEGDLSEQELDITRCDQTVDNSVHRFRDEEYYAKRDFRLEDIQIPLLSVANLGGIGLHLRGNVQGYMHSSSKFKYLRFIVGRHDLPFYYKENVALQRSFLDAWLKDEDRIGWTKLGAVAPVSLVLRKGNVPHNDEIAEKAFLRRDETEWPLSRTQYTRYYLHRDSTIQLFKDEREDAKATYSALGSIERQHKLEFISGPFGTETEITGHIICHLNVSLSAAAGATSIPNDIDLFITLRHLDSEKKEINYTGTVGDPVPIVKGWLRCSLRKIDITHPRHRPYLPYRNYFSTDREGLQLDKVYSVDVEIWPTSVVIDKGHFLVCEVSSGDTEGSGLFLHQGPEDRHANNFAGRNHIHFGKGKENYLQLPIIPRAESP